jgi:hypothetical protein
LAFCWIAIFLAGAYVRFALPWQEVPASQRSGQPGSEVLVLAGMAFLSLLAIPAALLLTWLSAFITRQFAFRPCVPVEEYGDEWLSR